MDAQAKKELLSLLASCMTQLLSDDCEEEQFLISAASELFKFPKALKNITAKKPKKKITKKDVKTIKEAKYLAFSRFETIVKPKLSLIEESDLCTWSLKSIKCGCFCKLHRIDEKDEHRQIYVQQTGGSLLSDVGFRAQWMFGRSTVEAVFSLINQSNDVGDDVTAIELLAFLYKLVHDETPAALELRFKLTLDKLIDSQNKIFKRIALLRRTFERWPVGSAVNLVSNGFLRKTGLRSVLGVIGCAYFLCKKAPFDPKSYRGPSGHLSIAMELVCDHLGRITSSSYTFLPGSRPVAEVHRLAKLNVPVPPPHFLVGPGGFSSSKHVAVPFAEELVKPSETLSAQRRTFNKMHQACFGILTNAVGSMVTRFKILHGLEMRHSSFVRQVVSSCIILHNIAIDMEDVVCVALDSPLKLDTFVPSSAGDGDDNPVMKKRRDEIVAELVPDTEDYYEEVQPVTKKRKYNKRKK